MNAPAPTHSTDTRVSVDPANAAGQQRILICDDLAAVAIEVFRRHGFEPEVRTGMDESTLIEAVPGVDALVVRSATKITRSVIEASDRLRVIGRAGVGVDNVDCASATQRGVVVMNTPTGNTTTTGELAISLMCSIARHIPRADRSVRGGQWKKKGLTGTELTGKTLGIIGLGRIGRVVAERALGLRMRVVAYDPYLQDTGSASPAAGVELCSLDELLGSSDFISLHVPLNDATRNIISEEAIAKIKPGARIINAARGGLIDEHALAAALDTGQLHGAALDVLSQEPPPSDHPLIQRDDVILTPHLGASSHEAQHNVAVAIADQISRFLLEGVADNAVNAPAISAQDLNQIAPYVLLAEKMGSFLAQRMQEPIRKVELTLSGDIAEADHRPVSLALLVGVLKQGMDVGVNFVNAPLLAKERGIRLLESSDEDAHFFQSQLKVRASSKGGEESHLVAGTVFGRSARFVRVDDLHLDLEPQGPLLITRHADVPGVVGMLGTVLGDHRVNIRRIELGPAESKQGADQGLAVGFLALHEEPGPDVLEALSKLDPVRDVRLVRM